MTRRNPRCRSRRWWPFLSLVGVLCILPVPAQQNRFQEGELFSSQEFPRLADGQPASITQFRGRKLVLHIFASW